MLKRTKASAFNTVAGTFAVGLLLALASTSVWAHGSFHQRLARLDAQIEEEGADADLLLRRASLYRDHRDWEAALADVERAAGVDPERADLDLHRGRIHLEAGRFVRAEASLLLFLQHDPRHARAHLWRARSLSQLNRHREAAAAFGRAIEAEPIPIPEHHLEWARALAAAGDLEAALRSLDAGMAKLGPIVSLESEAVGLEVQRGRFDGALSRLEGITRRSPRPEAWLVRRGEILEQAGRPAEAREAYARAETALAGVAPRRRGTQALLLLRQRLRAGQARVGAPEVGGLP